jgi:SAM-dependent methyltransferase
MDGFYDDPAIYDLLSSPGTAAEVEGLLSIARRYAGMPAGRRGRKLRWLEPACGSGRYLRALAARGDRVCGFDSHATMIAYARARGRRLGIERRARVVEADMRCFAALVGLSQFDVAFNLFNSIRHLESDAALLAHLREMARALRPGGIYAVGLSLTRYGLDPVEEDVWDARRGGCRVRQVVQYLPPGTGPESASAPVRPARFEQVVSHLAIERRSGTEHRDHTYRLRCYDEAQWRRVVGRSPLRWVASVDGSGRPYAGRPLPYAIDVLMRPPRGARPPSAAGRCRGRDES